MINYIYIYYHDPWLVNMGGGDLFNKSSPGRFMKSKLISNLSNIVKMKVSKMKDVRYMRLIMYR